MKQSTHQPKKNRSESKKQRDVISIRFFAPVESNKRHPLADVDPETRNSERERVIAQVLARLAEAAADISTENGTIGSEIKLFKEVRHEVEARASNEAN